MVYYYYAMETDANCYAVGTTVYGMTFPSQINLPCPHPPQTYQTCPECIPGTDKRYDPCPDSPQGSGAGQKELDCSKPERCGHWFMSKGDTDLEIGGLGGLSNLPYGFNYSNGDAVSSKLYMIPGKQHDNGSHDDICVACCTFKLPHGTPFGVGLEIPAAKPTTGATAPPDLSKCGPIKGKKSFHYFIEDGDSYYHVLTSRPVK
jgi:hypothetical protein